MSWLSAAAGLVSKIPDCFRECLCLGSGNRVDQTTTTKTNTVVNANFGGCSCCNGKASDAITPTPGSKHTTEMGPLDLERIRRLVKFVLLLDRVQQESSLDISSSSNGIDSPGKSELTPTVTRSDIYSEDQIVVETPIISRVDLKKAMVIGSDGSEETLSLQKIEDTIRGLPLERDVQDQEVTQIIHNVATELIQTSHGRILRRQIGETTVRHLLTRHLSLNPTHMNRVIDVLKTHIGPSWQKWDPDSDLDRFKSLYRFFSRSSK